MWVIDLSLPNMTFLNLVEYIDSDKWVNLKRKGQFFTQVYMK